MNPRASMPTTLSTLPRPKCTTIRSVIVENAMGSASTGVMSLNTMPGSGKSGTSRIRALISSISTDSPPLPLGRRALLVLRPGLRRGPDPRGGGLRGGIGRARRGDRARGRLGGGRPGARGAAGLDLLIALVALLQHRE